MLNNVSLRGFVHRAVKRTGGQDSVIETFHESCFDVVNYLDLSESLWDVVKETTTCRHQLLTWMRWPFDKELRDKMDDVKKLLVKMYAREKKAANGVAVGRNVATVTNPIMSRPAVAWGGLEIEEPWLKPV